MSSTPNGNAFRDDARVKPNRPPVFLFLLAFRILNALTLRTFFQPDEYYQSLEPAWQLAFGSHSGAWLTWVCTCISGTHPSTRPFPPFGLGAGGSRWLPTNLRRRNGRTAFGRRCTRCYLPASITLRRCSQRFVALQW